MDEYQFLRLVHIVSSTVVFGTGLGTAFHMWFSHRSGNVPAIAVAAKNTVLADWLFTTPAIIVQPASGIGLAFMAGYDLTESWLVTTYLLYFVVVASWLPVVFIQMKIRDIAEGCAQTGTPLSADYARHMRLWFALGWPAFLSIIVIFGLMVSKPTLW